MHKSHGRLPPALALLLHKGRRLPPLHVARHNRRLPQPPARSSADRGGSRHSTPPASWAAAARTPFYTAPQVAAATPTPHFRRERRRPPLLVLPRDGWRLPPPTIPSSMAADATISDATAPSAAAATPNPCIHDGWRWAPLHNTNITGGCRPESLFTRTTGGRRHPHPALSLGSAAAAAPSPQHNGRRPPPPLRASDSAGRRRRSCSTRATDGKRRHPSRCYKADCSCRRYILPITTGGCRRPNPAHRPLAAASATPQHNNHGRRLSPLLLRPQHGRTPPPSHCTFVEGGGARRFPSPVKRAAATSTSSYIPRGWPPPPFPLHSSRGRQLRPLTLSLQKARRLPPLHRPPHQGWLLATQPRTSAARGGSCHSSTRISWAAASATPFPAPRAASATASPPIGRWRRRPQLPHTPIMGGGRRHFFCHHSTGGRRHPHPAHPSRAAAAAASPP